VERVDLIQRVELREPLTRGVGEKIGVGLEQLLPHQTGGSTVAPPGAHARGHRLQPDRRTRNFAGALEPRRRCLVIVNRPEVDEPDVVQQLPAIRIVIQSLLEQRHGEIRPARTPGISLAQEDGPHPIRDKELRVERGRDVEQRIEQVIVLLWLAGTAHGAVVDDCANPVDIGCERIEFERHAIEESGRMQPEHRQLGRRFGHEPLADHL
jgi:hypothetical protein